MYQREIDMAELARKPMTAGKWVRSLRNAADSRPDHLISHIIQIQSGVQPERPLEEVSTRRASKASRKAKTDKS